MTLLDLAERRVADTSLEAFARVRKDLPLRDLQLCEEVAHYVDVTRHPDVTGAELAQWMDLECTTTRPALTRAYQAGWLEKGEKRRCRVRRTSARGYRLAVPREAITRAIAHVKEKTCNAPRAV